MPRKKQKKTREEMTAEEFFPMNPEKIKITIEKPQKEADVKTLEKIEEVGDKKIVKKKRKSPLKTKTKNKKGIIFQPQKVILKKDGYELIVTEKPQAALKIAAALGDYKTKTLHGVSYYELTRQNTGKKVVVACAVGHLFTLESKDQKSKIPSFDLVWLPNYMVKKQDFTKKYLDLLIELVKNANEVTIATDYDIEGELIGFNVIRFAAGLQDANRMKFSTLTEKELNESYEKKSKTIDWGQAISGETRHILDWYYGINISRLLMQAIKSTGRFRIFSIGRVQGPALNIIVKKEKEIQDFKSQKYWQVFVTLKKPKGLELKYIKDIFKKEELKKFENIIGKKASVSTEKDSQKILPPTPFNLTTLQTEAYSFYGINPGRTLQIAQSLYLSGLISYPRTSSQKLPPAVGYNEILKKISQRYRAEYLIKRKNPIEGKKTDPAHPSIYPTGNFQELKEEELKIYNLIAKRFLALFCEDATIDNKTIKAEVNGLIFTTKGSSIKNKGWMEIYPSKVIEKSVPDVNGEIPIENSKVEEKETQPPRRYTQASLISELEKRNLGTKATRSSILETLYTRGYVKDQSIKATPLGISMINTLGKHSPIIIDEALTREFEKNLEAIQASKKDFFNKETKIVEKAKETIEKISLQFKSQEKEIGQELLGAIDKLNLQAREENKLNECPECHKGSLVVLYSKKNKRYFVACNKYPDCRKTFSLPPNSLIKKANKNCESCSWPMLISIRKGKRPWIFCFNPDCETNKKRLEEYRKRHNQNTENSNA